MVDILQHIHQYVPRSAAGEYYPIFFDGDQVMRERASGAQDAKLQADEEVRKLKGVFPQVADWHTLVTFYQVMCMIASVYVCTYILCTYMYTSACTY